MSLNILLVSDSMVKERTVIFGNIDPKMIYPDIKVAQDMYILPILGSALFDKLQTDISNSAIAGNYKILLDKFIVDCLIYHVLADLTNSVSFQITNKGVIRKTGDNSEPASMSELIDIANKHRNVAEFYATRLIKYLKQNAAELFPEYLNPGNGIDTIRPEHSAFTMPVFLGDDDCCSHKSYEERYQGNNPKCC